jgi:hypothetical protein
MPNFYESEGRWYCWSWLDTERILIAMGDSRSEAEINWREAVKRARK